MVQCCVALRSSAAHPWQSVALLKPSLRRVDPLYKLGALADLVPCNTLAKSSTGLDFNVTQRVYTRTWETKRVS